MTLSIGVEAPDFTLKTKTPEGLEEVTLSQFKGQNSVVLLFSPFPSLEFAPRKPARYETTYPLTRNWMPRYSASASTAPFRKRLFPVRKV